MGLAVSYQTFSRIKPGTRLCELASEDRYVIEGRLGGRSFTEIARQFGCKPATIARRYRKIVEDVFNPQLDLLTEDTVANKVVNIFTEGLSAMKQTRRGPMPDYRTRLKTFEVFDDVTGGLLGRMIKRKLE